MSAEQLTGAEVRHLMRCHRKTIRCLAKHMNITLTRVRDVRSRGVRGKEFVMDWVEAITGTTARIVGGKVVGVRALNAIVEPTDADGEG